MLLFAFVLERWGGCFPNASLPLVADVRVFLPPYYPRGNAIEEAFSCVKAYLSNPENQHIDRAAADFPQVLSAIFRKLLTSRRARGWVGDGGYYKHFRRSSYARLF